MPASLAAALARRFLSAVPSPPRWLPVCCAAPARFLTLPDRRRSSLTLVPLPALPCDDIISLTYLTRYSRVEIQP